MDKRIVFKTDDGGIAVIIPPNPEDCELTLVEIAAKDVPSGRVYAIIDTADVPADRTHRIAWTVDPSTLIDGVGE